MSDHKSTLTAILVDGVSGPARQIKAEITGLGGSISAVSAVLTGIGLAIGETLFRGFEAAFSKITELIPDLIQKGNDYLGLLKNIQLETGLTAQQTSALVGVAADYGVSAESLTRVLAQLGRNVVANEANFKRFGIATRDTKGDLLDTWTMFQQVRQAIAAHGASLETAGIAQKLFGKGAQELLPILSLTDEEFKTAVQSVGEFGGIVSQAAIDGAEKFKRGLDTLRQGVVDIGVNIASALDPYLEQFITNFTAFVKLHLNDIINFFVVVANAVIGFISGLFGITNAVQQVAPALDTATKAGSGWTDTLAAATKQNDQFNAAINDQIKAIDAQSKAITNREQARHAARERERLATSLSEAQTQLADLRGNAPFTAGLSAAEQQLAIQKHAQDVIDAEKNVANARKAIGDFELDQRDQAEQELLRREKARLQERLTATNATFKQMAAGGLQLAKGIGDNIGGELKNVTIDTQRFGASAKAAFETGMTAASGFLDILLGAQVSLGPEGYYRTGGVVGALGQLGDAIAKVGAIAAGFAAWINRNIGNLGLGAQTLQSLLGIPNINSGRGGGGFGGFPFFGRPPGSARGGWVGTRGPELRLVGEEGPEYVVPNNQLGRGGVVVHNHFDFISMPSRTQLRELADAIDEIFQMKADNAPVGIRGFTGSMG